MYKKMLKDQIFFLPPHLFPTMGWVDIVEKLKV